MFHGPHLLLQTGVLPAGLPLLLTLLHYMIPQHGQPLEVERRILDQISLVCDSEGVARVHVLQGRIPDDGL